VLLAVAFVLAAGQLAAERPFLRSEFIFPLEHWHNHSSSVVELPNGELFAVWYNGSGERTADDVKVEASRLAKGASSWSPRFTLADAPGFPDCNPAVFLDSSQRLWLFWPVILANEWHTALLKYKVSSNYSNAARPPVWDREDALLLAPQRFAERVEQAVKANWPASEFWNLRIEMARDKYSSRMGWMPRAHPIELPGGRILLPLYSDGFDFSLMAISDDRGATWTSSAPLMGGGAVQPSLARRRDGTIVAFLRDNGPPPKRILVSESRDNGETWQVARDTEWPNPGSGLEVIVLKDGRWAMIYNDTERGREALAVSLSDDEGKTWKWTRHLEKDTQNKPPGSFHYPSMIQGKDGSLHATYSYFLNHIPAGRPRKTIKHAHFNVEWILAGTK
jgi:predicted neuraminidase